MCYSHNRKLIYLHISFRALLMTWVYLFPYFQKQDLTISMLYYMSSQHSLPLMPTLTSKMTLFPFLQDFHHFLLHHVLFCFCVCVLFLFFRRGPKSERKLLFLVSAFWEMKSSARRILNLSDTLILPNRGFQQMSGKSLVLPLCQFCNQCQEHIIHRLHLLVCHLQM